jgi:hypothetical protein
LAVAIAGCAWLAGTNEARRRGSVMVGVIQAHGGISYRDGRGGRVSVLDRSRNGGIPSKQWLREHGGEGNARPVRGMY